MSKVLISNENGIEVEEHTMTDKSLSYNVNIRTESSHTVIIGCGDMEEAEILASYLRLASWIDVV